MGKPYFSVVIDNYNYGRYVGQAVESVLDQDFPPSEVETIVVDDGSTDDSLAVVHRYVKGGNHQPRRGKVRIISQKNQGQAGAFATGFAAASGEAVCLLDSDDYWHPAKLRETARALKDPTVGIVQHYQRDVDAQGRALNNPLPDWPPRYTLKDFLDGRFVNAATSSLAFRRSVLDRVLPVPKGVFYLYDDYLLDHGLFHADVANVPRILGCHRIHGSNNWAQGMLNPKKLEGTIRETRAFRAHLEPKLKDRGLAFSPGCLAVQDMELRRREILLAMHRGERVAAFRVWRGLVAAHGGTPFGLFRSGTCLLALLSPDLYLRAYGLYGDLHWLARARRRLLPEASGSP